jgi:hypothetical protein
MDSDLPSEPPVRASSHDLDVNGAPALGEWCRKGGLQTAHGPSDSSVDQKRPSGARIATGMGLGCLSAYTFC